MYPNSTYFGLKHVVPAKVLYGQGIYYLGTWTLIVEARKLEHHSPHAVKVKQRESQH